jgi:hypothetical protein
MGFLLQPMQSQADNKIKVNGMTTSSIARSLKSQGVKGSSAAPHPTIVQTRS